MNETRVTEAEQHLLDRIRDRDSSEAEISKMYRETWETGPHQKQIWRDIDGAIAYKWGLNFSNYLSDWAAKNT